MNPRSASQSPDEPDDDHGRPPGQPTEPQDPLAPTARRIEMIIDTAERAANEIRADARAQADRRLQDARQHADTITQERVSMLAELTGALIDHASLIATQTEGLLGALEGTMRELPAGTDPERALPPPARDAPAEQPHAEPPRTDVPSAQDARAQSAPARPAAAASPSGPRPAGVPEEAFLRATRLALDGFSRDAIARELETEFGIQDPAPVLERVLGRS